jgi:hypothetical protein
MYGEAWEIDEGGVPKWLQSISLEMLIILFDSVSKL